MLVERFAFAVSPDVPVQYKDILVRVGLFDGNGLQNGSRTADPGAVGPLILPGAHTLDEHDRPGILEFFRVMLKVVPAGNPIILAIKVLGRVGGLTAGGHDDPAMGYRLGRTVGRDLGLEITHEPGSVRHLGIQQHRNVRMFFHPGNHVIENRLDGLSLPGLGQIPGLAANGGGTFDDGRRKPLFCQAEGRGHTGRPAADDQGGLVDLHGDIADGIEQSRPGNRHPHEILGLVGGLVFFIGMYPGTLVADIGHFKEIRVEPGIAHGFLEQRFVGPRRTGSHDNAVELLFFDDLNHLLLGILGTGKKILFHVSHPGQTPGVFGNSRHIRDAADVGTAIADKYTDAVFLALNRDLFGKCLLFDQFVSDRRQGHAGPAGSRTGFHNGLRDVLGPLEGTADIDALP